MWKISLWSVEIIVNQSTANFYWISNSIEISLVGRAPGVLKRYQEWLRVHCGDQRHAGFCLGWRPCMSRSGVQGHNQGTTLSASDLHNARATILNPFYNMEYKIIKKIRQNTMWIEADILGINLTPSRYNAHAPATIYISNDVTIPFNSVTSQ